MASDKFELVAGSEHLFGQRVLEWAKWRNYENDPNNHSNAPSNSRTPPRNLEQAEQQTEGLVLTPDFFRAANFYTTDKEVWHVRIPPYELMKQRLDDIAQGEKYTVPEFYKKFLALPNPSAKDREWLFQCRIGEYSCQLCG